MVGKNKKRIIITVDDELYKCICAFAYLHLESKSKAVARALHALWFDEDYLLDVYNRFVDK